MNIVSIKSNPLTFMVHWVAGFAIVGLEAHYEAGILVFFGLSLVVNTISLFKEMIAIELRGKETTHERLLKDSYEWVLLLLRFTSGINLEQKRGLLMWHAIKMYGLCLLTTFFLANSDFWGSILLTRLFLAASIVSMIGCAFSYITPFRE